MQNRKSTTITKETAGLRKPASSQIPSTRSILLLLGWVLLFAVAAVVITYFTYVGVRGFVASWELTSLPGVGIKAGKTAIPGQSDGGEVEPTAQPVIGATPEPWDGASRVNVLVMGLDYRDWEAGEGAPRTDTMILISIDPLTKTGGMLSIPRDLWVTIPGFDEPNRINTAYRFGEIYKLPGGGPGLAMRTVEALLGLKIDFYAQIEFSAFERLIDELGGVKVDIDKKIKVVPIGGSTVTLKPGRQVLPGDLALAYARARYTESGDFDRATRQQQVIMGIRNRVFSPGALPVYVAKASTLYEEFTAGVHTNLTLEQAIKLAWLAQQIPEENIKRGIIGPKQVTFGKSPEGDDILKPMPVQIRILRDEIFTASGLVEPSAGDASTQELMQAESARITIFNGSNTPGLAARTMEYLQTQGVNVAGTGDSPSAATYTTIIDHTGNPRTVQFLVDLMGIFPQKIYLRYDPANQTDLELILGYDWANNNSMP